MLFKKICIRHVRNIVEQQFDLSPGVNLLLGANGSGKSSILESLHLLGYGRSFRTHHNRPLIQFGESTLVITADILSDHSDHSERNPVDHFGYQKSLNGKTIARLNQENVSFIHMIRLLPIQIIHPESFDQLYTGAASRRKILDWGMFHVEPSFGLLWGQYQKVLKQRNAALKQAVILSEISCWDDMMSNLGEQIEAIRYKWIESFLLEARGAVKQLLPTLSPLLSLSYYSGWTESENTSLRQALGQSLLRDRHVGTTRVGPHRADLVIRYGAEIENIENMSIEKVLSRGQQKLMMLALFMAQAKWLQNQTGKKSVLLIDDIISELDNKNIAKLLAFIAEQQQQVLMTAVDEKGVDFGGQVAGLRRFVIEEGRVCRVDG